MDQNIRKIDLLCKLILSAFFLSVITIKIGRINVAVGDLLLPILITLLIYLSSKNNGLVGRNKGKVLTVSYIIFSIVILSIFSLINYFGYSFSIKSSLIELFKFLIAISYGILAAILFFKMDIENNFNKEKINNMLLNSLLIVSLSSIVGVLIYMLGIDNTFVMNGGRAKGTMSDTNITGIFLTVYIPLVLSNVSKFNKIKTKITVAFGLVAILLTASKAAILVSIISILMLILFSLYLNKYKQLKKIFLFLIIIFIMIYMIYNNTQLLDNLIIRLNDFSSGDTSKITTGRSDLWKYAISLINNGEHLLFGIGYGSYAHFISTQAVPYYLQGITLIHNTLLSMLVETGILNFLLIIIVIGSLLINSFRKIIRKKKYSDIFTFIALINLIIGMNEVNLQNNRFLYIVFVYIFFNNVSAIKKVTGDKERKYK